VTPSPFPLFPSSPLLACDVLIIGAGPVGLFLGCRLAQLGISFKIIEKRTSHFQHSRSIGIHPPSLEKLEPLGVVNEIVRRGTAISKGHGFISTTYIGALDFSKCPKPYNFVVTLPQFETEAILEKRLCELAPMSLLRGYEVVNLEQDSETIHVKIENKQVRFQQGDSSPCKEQSTTDAANLVGQQQLASNLNAKFVIACDGKDSTVRQLVNIPFHGRDYPDTYVMGDFADNTTFGSDAAIYLTNEGLIESFPLAHGVRRWVAKTNERVTEPNVELLAQLVKKRVRHELPLGTNTMLSSFGVQRYLAETFVKNRVILAGDAAHVLSPIGGQGMNLGWLDAWALAKTLENILLKSQDATKELNTYDSSRQRSSRIAIRRAEFNMRMGRRTRFNVAKHVLASVLLKEPFATRMAKMFTMRGL
jgi:2-polyprenyl-6-methoxyphenol hydroxylase-like FAD-dependent oxidoreductase